MKKILLLATALTVLSGCGVKYCKSGASANDFKRDHYECKHRARQMAQFGDIYDPFEDVAQQRECLEMKGWSRCSE